MTCKNLFYTLKPLFKSKSSTRNFSKFFSVAFIFRMVLIHLNNICLFLNCILTKNRTAYLRLLTELPKITKIAIFLFFCFPKLLFRCGNIKANPGLKYLSLTSCHWNLNGLTTHDSIKISLLQAYIIQHNLT